MNDEKSGTKERRKMWGNNQQSRYEEKKTGGRELMYVPDIIPHLLCYSECLRQTENAAELLREKLLLAK